MSAPSIAVTFRADPHHSARANLEAFINHCREVNALGVPDWDAVQWDVRGTFSRKGRTAPVRLNWTDLDSKKGGIDAAERNTPLPKPFVDFAKSYLSYCHGLRQASGIDGPPLMAMRVIERALKQVKNTGEVSQIDANVLNTAASLAKAKWAKSTAAQVGARLQELAEHLTSNHLTELTLTWKSPLRRDPDQGLYRVGPEADARRSRQLPDDEIMQAVAKAFHLAVEPRDVLVSSVSAVLTCSPDRIGEVLNLRRDALVLETLNGKPTVGLRWYPEKGGKPIVKPVPPVMQDVARRAYEQLLEVTAMGHELAKWYAKHPTQMFLPKNLLHLRTRDLLTLAEVRDLLGVEPSTNVRRLLGELGSAGGPDPVPRGMVRFSALEKFVLSELPDDFPMMEKELGLKYTEALLVVPLRFFKGGAPSRVMLMRVAYDHLVRQLGNSDDPKNSLFGRLELTQSDGSPIRLRTHQVRHWLNTLARKGGLGELDIALWSGRKDVRSNAAYDNLSAEDALALVKQATEPHEQQLVEFVVREPISRGEFDVLKIKTGHVTDYGVCIHDYAMAPCQKHRDCINCDEQICVKGDVASNARIRRALELTEQLHKKAVEALGDNWNGAGRWEAHHHLSLTRLRELVRILDDDQYEEGSIIKLQKGGAHSILQQAMRESRRLSQERRNAAVAAIRLFHAKPTGPQREEHIP